MGMHEYLRHSGCSKHRSFQLRFDILNFKREFTWQFNLQDLTCSLTYHQNTPEETEFLTSEHLDNAKDIFEGCTQSKMSQGSSFNALLGAVGLSSTLAQPANEARKKDLATSGMKYFLQRLSITLSQAFSEHRGVWSLVQNGNGVNMTCWNLLLSCVYHPATRSAFHFPSLHPFPLPRRLKCLIANQLDTHCEPF